MSDRTTGPQPEHAPPERDLDLLRSLGREAVDPQIAALPEAEMERQRGQIELIASRTSPGRPCWVVEALIGGGQDLLTGGTDTHLLQLDPGRSEWTGQAAERRLDDIGITVNRNTVPFDEPPSTVASGVRFGTPAITMRGLDEDGIREVGAILVEALAIGAPDLEALRRRAEDICERRTLYAGFRGYTLYGTAEGT